MAGLIALLVVLVIALYVCWLMIQPFFNVLMWAAVLSVVFYPDAPADPRPDREAVAGGGALDAARHPADPAAGDVHHRGGRPRAERRGGVVPGVRRHLAISTPSPRVAWIVDRVGQYVDFDRDVGAEVPRRAHADLGRRACRQHADRRRRRRRRGRRRRCWSSSRCSTSSATASASARRSTRWCRCSACSGRTSSRARRT